MSRLAPAFGGVAVVCCVHNREKRKITDLVYDAAREKPRECACCENLFTDPTDTPMLCPQCRGVNVHPLGGPLNDPTGVL